MNVLVLAHMQLENEGKENSKHYLLHLFNRADKIVKYLDIQVRNKKVAENRYKNIKKVVSISR